MIFSCCQRGLCGPVPSRLSFSPPPLAHSPLSAPTPPPLPSRGPCVLTRRGVWMDFPVGYLVLTACLFFFFPYIHGQASWQFFFVASADPCSHGLALASENHWQKGFSSLDKSSPPGPDTMHVHHPSTWKAYPWSSSTGSGLVVPDSNLIFVTRRCSRDES